MRALRTFVIALLARCRGGAGRRRRAADASCRESPRMACDRRIGADRTSGPRRWLAARLVAAIDGAMVQSSAASGRSGRGRSDAFVFGSVSAARRVLSAWRRVHRATPSGSVPPATCLRAGKRKAAWWPGAAARGLAWSWSKPHEDARSVRAGAARRSSGRRMADLSTSRHPWAKVLDQIRPDGTVSKHTALEAFAVAYGPLPGVRIPPGRRTTIPSGSLAAQWILSYWRH